MLGWKLQGQGWPFTLGRTPSATWPAWASGLGWTVEGRATLDMPQLYISESRARHKLLITDGLAFKQGTWKEAFGPSLGPVAIADKPGQCQEMPGAEERAGSGSDQCLQWLHMAECLMGAFPSWCLSCYLEWDPPSRFVK